jgi:hypothetical protein
VARRAALILLLILPLALVWYWLGSIVVNDLLHISGLHLLEFFRITVWPLVVVCGLLALRRPLSGFIEGLGQRATKLSIFNLEVELSRAPELKPWSGPSLDTFRQPDPAFWGGDSSGELFAQIQAAGPADYAIVDLGRGEAWLTSRLFIFTLMMERMRGLRCLVFLKETDAASRLFLGTASPSRVRWALARQYPWLEVAYAKAYSQALPDEPQTMSSKMGIITSDGGAIEPYRAMNIAKEFLRNIQVGKPRPPNPSQEWQKLDRNLWERAAWLNESELRRILNVNLEDFSWIEDAPDASPEAQLQIALRQKSPFVTLVVQGRFKSLIDRQALLEAVGLQLAGK